MLQRGLEPSTSRLPFKNQNEYLNPKVAQLLKCHENGSFSSTVICLLSLFFSSFMSKMEEYSCSTTLFSPFLLFQGGQNANSDKVMLILLTLPANKELLPPSSSSTRILPFYKNNNSTHTSLYQFHHFCFKKVSNHDKSQNDYKTMQNKSMIVTEIKN